MLKRIIKAEILFWIVVALLSLICSCKENIPVKESAAISKINTTEDKPFNKKNLSSEFKSYWYSGEAEVSSYKLEQARYGEIREGNAVLVFVTEDFLPSIQVKADNQNASNIPVLKLNATKKFLTGIYPYSIMQSTFYPVSNKSHALKVSCSVQEWCGHVYVQLNNRESFEIMSHSYFEGEADAHFNLDKTVLENELWTKLRINPQSLPTGDLQIIPSLEFTRLRHIPIKAYAATATLTDGKYTLNYPDLNRTLCIQFNPNFPYDILEWEETFKSGFGPDPKILTSKATKLKTIKTAYWQKNHIEDEVLRETLQLN
ncbi:septum formation inhibitor Maf [Sabulilitoribacter multivorans]|uniref:Septum formation inhibitor Maf n=1 Tax=Flaviramulus multivorans TaxID=1304750 RepID=A0ABS9IMM8_9FLAO|nr:septum formation inhibitor Maf [Flaviramulus multivorans]MCF7561840.1 septum formation inhibitor Maf [Flaviramulus multivorans]